MSFVDAECEIKTKTKTENETGSPPSESDAAWKSILDTYFQHTMAFLYPHLHEKIDWSFGYHALENELQAITAKAAIGKRIVDKLMQVHFCTGQSLVHLEIQGSRQADFPERVYDYYSRLRLHYKQPIIVLVILTDDNPKWRPEHYRNTIWDQLIVDFRFYSVKLLDYRNKKQLLIESKNPVAWMILVQLAATETRQHPDKRFHQKYRLMCLLYDRSYPREAIIELYTFSDRILPLPEDLEISYNEQIKQFEEEYNMRYVTSIERQGIKQGMQQGMQQGECVMLQRQLQRKFKQIPQRYLDKLQQADSEALLRWSETILEARSLADVFEE